MPPFHPGEFLADDLEAMQMSPAEFDASLSVPAGTTALFLDGCIDITPELALRLSRYFGGGAELWLSLQAGYDVKVYARKHGPSIVAQVVPMRDEGGNSYFVWGQ
ncbi:MAG: HigA family addiction module antidote protein [Dehalococcoidia bacterium]|nr:HigA family addiction module antidote protein [Dehalococcoidia bacterium]